MARLKRDNSSWRAHGLYKKYQQPAVKEPSSARRSKKDTNKWCRGKVGNPHDWHRYQAKRYNCDLQDYVSPYIEIKCIECRKEKYIKTAKSANYTLHVWIDEPDKTYMPIQVKVNGKVLPIEEYQYHKNEYWCWQCRTWH